MYDETTYETIERYLEGGLQGEELRDFEARLQADEQLREEVELHRGIEAAFGDDAAMNFLRAVETVGEEYLEQGNKSQDDAPEPKVVRPFWRQSYSIAAAVLVLAVVGFFALRGLGGNEPAELFQQYYTVYDGAEWRGNNEVLDSKLKAAFDAYNARNFDAAQKAFAELETLDPDNSTVTFFHAMSALANKDTDPAITRLKKLSETTGHSYRSQSTWYLALAYLSQDDADSAQPLLESLSGKPGKYGQLATELLGKL